MPRPNGAIIYQGPSVLTGDPIVAIATGLRRRSANTKTGAMVQTWILALREAPHTAVWTGADTAVCGQCPLRPLVTPAGVRACYVRTMEAPLSVWRAYYRGVYAPIDSLQLAGRMLRLGSYGDPVAVPFASWEPLLTVVRRHTGYTHQWAHPAAAWARPYLMASVQSPATFAAADAAGWRTFYVLRPGAARAESPSRRTIQCPASAESGHRTTCERCGLCNGTGGLARVHIAINAH